MTIRSSVRVRGAAAAAVAAIATFAAVPVGAGAATTVARYDAAKLTVGALVGGYGWAAWTTQSVGSSRLRLQLRSPAGRRFTVPLHDWVNGSVELVRIQDPGGRPRVVMRLEVCVVKRGAAVPGPCTVGIVDVKRRRFEAEPAWLGTSAPFHAPDNVPASIEDRTVVRVAGGLEGCTVTATDLDGGETTFSPIPDCQPSAPPVVRGSRILVTTGSPSGDADYQSGSAAHLLDLKVLDRGWTTVSARLDGRTGSHGSDGGVLLGDQLFDRAIDLTSDPYGTPPVERSSRVLRRRELPAPGPLPEPVALPAAFAPSALKSVASTDRQLVVQTQSPLRRKVGKRTKTIDQIRIQAFDPAELTATP